MNGYMFIFKFHFSSLELCVGHVVTGFKVMDVCLRRQCLEVFKQKLLEIVVGDPDLELHELVPKFVTAGVPDTTNDIGTCLERNGLAKDVS